MALPDLTGQNIQDTYQRVLQTDSGTLRDGTGSLVDELTIPGTGSFGRLICTTISASSGDFDANTIRIGGTSFNKVELLPKNFLRIPTALGVTFEIVSEVICLVSNSNSIPVFLYLECLGFMHELFYSYINI